MDEVKPKIPQRVADINAEIARQGNKGFSVAPSAPTYVPPTTISSSILQNDVKPFSIPTPTMGTSNADLNALLATSASQTKADALAEQTRLAQETAQNATDTSKSNLYDAFLKKIGVQQTKGAVQEQFGVAGKTQKVTDLTNQLEALDKAELDEIRNLGSQPGTLAQKAQREQDIRSNYNMRKADIAILQSAANRDLATASALAEAKINTQLEPLNTQIEFLSMFYEDNKEQLSKADQNAFNVAIQDAQAERTQKASELKILSDTKLEVLKNIYANASPEVANQLARSVQMATTPEQVMMAAGQFSTDVLERQIKQAQLDKLNTELTKLRTGDTPSFDVSTPTGQVGAMAQTLASKFGSKFQQEAFLNNVTRLSKGNNPQDLADYVLSEAISQIPDSDQRKKTIARYGLVNKLNVLEEQLAAYYALDGDTGLLIGTREQIQNKLGKTGNPKLAELGISMLDTLDSISRDRTGAALTESEEKFYERLTPSGKKVPELNQAVINGLRSSVTTDINSQLRFQLTGTGFNTIEEYLGFQSNNSLITAAQEGRVKVDEKTGDLIIITD